jgi:hypothetical protein
MNLFTRNERGNPVARAIFRLLSDEHGKPALHVESVYSSDLSNGVSRAMYQHAVQKAEQMGVPVLASSISQNAKGHQVKQRQVNGIGYQPVETLVSSTGSQAAFVYVDSAGGPQSEGHYTIGDNVRLSIPG